ncbi:MAG: methyltransferase domain-containing protein [Candidatus Binatia bacterium]|nr:methyltransferase domain-containing protein [Candidatus Binatia bacterium]
MADYTDRPGERPSYRVSDEAKDAETERRRLSILGDLRDRHSAEHLTRAGLTTGWRCLDVGSGGGALARWIADQVGPTGSVLSTDIDIRFQPEGAGNLEVRQHDIVKEDLPENEFDLVHARAVLQTIDQREEVLDKFVRVLKPGGWLLVADPEWSAFEQQPLPAAFRALYETMMDVAGKLNGYDRHWANRMLSSFQTRGLEEIECRGDVSTMYGGTDSAEWLILAYERGAPSLVQAGLIDQATVDEGLREARRDDFLILGPISMACRGRKPAG